MLDDIYDNAVLSGPKSKVIEYIVKSHIKEAPIEIIRIRLNRKVYKLVFKNNPPMRLDLRYSKEITRLHKIAYDNGIEVPKVIKFVPEGKTGFKYSEWMEGSLLMRVWNISEMFYRCGELMGRMNLIKDTMSDGFLTNSEVSGANAIWTEDKRVYIIDHGRMKVVHNPDLTITQVLLKRIRNKERISIFLEGYSKYRDISGIKHKIEERNWRWDRDLRNNLPVLI